MVRRPAMLLLSAMLVGGSSLAPAAEPQTDPAPPNFVIVVTDDQRWDTIGRCIGGFDGLDLAAGADACMPFLQQDLLPRGVTFLRGYVTTAFCCPSRASILTGRYAHHTGVLDNTGYPQFFDDEASTIATWLLGGGYRTGLFGKYLNGYGEPQITPPNHVPAGWTSWHAIHESAEAGYKSYTLLEADPGQGPTLVAYNDRDSTSTVACASGNYYVTDLLCRKAVDYLAVDTTTPFALYFAPPSPHLPATPPRRWRSLYTGLPLPQYPNRNAVPAPDPPSWLPESPLGSSALSLIDKQFRSMLAPNRAVDDAVHAMVEQLAADGRLDSTVFVFVSDNGFARAEHRLDDKAASSRNATGSPSRSSARAWSVPVPLWGPSTPHTMRSPSTSLPPSPS
jgi:N-acetylglucosamine-6-sulfatase